MKCNSSLSGLAFQREMEVKKPQVVCIPFPGQGHINPMRQLAKLLHSRGFFITFFSTNSTHKRLLSSGGLDSLGCLDGFCFETISDGGKPPSAGDVMQDAEAFSECVGELHGALCNLQGKLYCTSGGPGLICLIWDRFMTFTLHIVEELKIPKVLFCPTRLALLRPLPTSMSF